MKKWNRGLSFLLTAVLLLGLLSTVPVLRVSAYRGSGTETDPYLVTTAEELSDIRKNLSAHYKLAATIDLTSVADFKPIGTMAKPFTGSFTCPLNTDGQPLYAILNLKVHTLVTPYIDVGASKWEAGLFGGAADATISNILILNAYIQNDNEGLNKGDGPGGTFLPGMDEMGTGILVGHALNCTITACGVTGVVDAKANGCGGLVGEQYGGSVINCWSAADVTTDGKWNSGGLIGDANDSAVISGCWASGNVKGRTSGIGALIGATTASVVQNCYATGNALTGLFGGCYSSTMINCYYTGKCERAANSDTDTGNTVNNVFVLPDETLTHTGFKNASEAEITAAFAGIKEWDTSGALPVLTNTKAPADLSAYQVGSIVGTPVDAETPPPAEDTSPTEPADDEQFLPLEGFLELLSTLPLAENVTLEHKQSICKLYAAAETYFDYGDIEAAQYKQVVDCFKALEALIVADLSVRIEALPDAQSITEAERATVETIQADFDLLEEEYQAYLSEQLRAKLTAVQSKLEELKYNPEPVSAPAYTAGELAVLIIFAVVLCLNTVTNIVIALVLYKEKRRKNNSQEEE